MLSSNLGTPLAMWLVRNTDVPAEDAETAAGDILRCRKIRDFDTLDLDVKKALVKVHLRTKVDELHRYLPFGSAIMHSPAYGDIQRRLLEEYHAAVDAAADADAFAALLATKLRFGHTHMDAMSNTKLHAQMRWQVGDLLAIMALTDGIERMGAHVPPLPLHVVTNVLRCCVGMEPL